VLCCCYCCCCSVRFSRFPSRFHSSHTKMSSLLLEVVGKLDSISISSHAVAGRAVGLGCTGCRHGMMWDYYHVGYYHVGCCGSGWDPWMFHGSLPTDDEHAGDPNRARIYPARE
jgi:hypothetical protein